MDTRLLCPWDFLGKSTGVGYHFLFQGIFPTQGSNPVLPHCRQMLYRLSQQGGKSDRKIWTWQGLEQVTREGMGQRVMGRRSDGLTGGVS